MNVRLKDSLSFVAAIYFNDTFIMNNYYVEIEMVTNNDDGEVVNIARERMKYWVSYVVGNSLFINEAETKKYEEFVNIGIKTIKLPDEPVEQIIGLMLYCKLSAIMEDNILISNLNISSELGDNCWYMHNLNEDIGPFDLQGWWHNADITYHDRVKEKKGRVVKLNENPSWNELDLAWPNDDAKESVIKLFKDEK